MAANIQQRREVDSISGMHLQPVPLPTAVSSSAVLSLWGGTRSLCLSVADLAHALLAVPTTAQEPHIEQSGNQIDLRFREFQLDPHLQPGAHGLFLSPAVSWAIEFRGGIADMEADLATLPLSRLAIYGGMSDVWLTLPAVCDDTQIVIVGDVGDASLLLSPNTASSLEVREQVIDAVLDGEHYSASNGMSWQSENAFSRPTYRISIQGSAERLNIGRHNRLDLQAKVPTSWPSRDRSFVE